MTSYKRLSGSLELEQCAVHAHEIVFFSREAWTVLPWRAFWIGVLNQRFKTLILPSQNKHERSLAINKWDPRSLSKTTRRRWYSPIWTLNVAPHRRLLFFVFVFYHRCNVITDKITPSVNVTRVSWLSAVTTFIIGRRIMISDWSATMRCHWPRLITAMIRV